MNRYVESKVRTNKLFCSGCGDKIHKNDNVIFELDGEKMENVYCKKCSKGYKEFIDDDDTHPFSPEAFEKY